MILRMTCTHLPILAGKRDDRSCTIKHHKDIIMKLLEVLLLSLVPIIASAIGDDNISSVENIVLVTGATGRLGSNLYFQLRDERHMVVRALVRSAEKARDVLGCVQCDESEGIYVGDVTDIDTLFPAAKGVSTVAIAVGASPSSSEGEIRAVEFESVQKTVRALVQQQDVHSGENDLRVVLCSSMGTTNPSPSFGGHILFWKLQAEAFLGSCGIGTTVVKPCGLLSDNNDGDSYTLLTGHDDTLLELDPPALPRSEVARVMAEAIDLRSEGLRFDLCAKPGPSTTDLASLLEGARWSWDQQGQQVNAGRV